MSTLFGERCVVCGEPMQRSAGSRCYDHHCDVKRETAIESGRMAHELGRRYARTFQGRLAAGFRMLAQGEDLE